ncbi:MAG: MBL fold metallo-hydrolase [Deltaproteobacteria bacterium]|nr:MBL fold metallo-hydrolase [Deltaproteobacteria bacterium]MBW2307384.1 MBL fold metallo-hydrolase [Deltaproteobacteria bacterium]
MNRRQFFTEVLGRGKKAAALSLLAGFAKLSATQASEEENSLPGLVSNFTLRELARRKIHHGAGRFVNPFNTRKHGNLLRVLYWKIFSENRFESFYDEERVIPVSTDWTPIREHQSLSVTFLNHASIMIKDLGQYILVDPVFFGLSRLIKNFSPFAFDFKQLPRPDHVLITHGHYDHLDTRSLAFLPGGTHVITPLGYNDIFADLNINRRTRLDWYDTFEDGRREITLLPCNHWTMRSPLEGPNRSLWGSFLLKSASGPTIFISGDTAYFNRFEEIGREFSIDLAIMNLGAYEPRWFMANSHMNPSETVRAFRELGAARLMIVHWGTFRLGDEPVHFPPMDIAREMEKEGLADQLVHLNHGETLFM